MSMNQAVLKLSAVRSSNDLNLSRCAAGQVSGVLNKTNFRLPNFSALMTVQFVPVYFYALK
jgi:hypothetical protein